MDNHDNILVSLGKELHSVRDQPRLLIILTHAFIEGRVDEIVGAKCKTGKDIVGDRNYTHSMKLVILHEAGLLNDVLFDALNWFRRLRNKVVHNPFYKPDKSHALAAKKKLTGFVPWVDRAVEFDSIFWHKVCSTLQSALWNYHVDTMRNQHM